MGRVLSDYQEKSAYSGPSSNFFFMANKIKVSSRTQKRFRNFPKKPRFGCQPSLFSGCAFLPTQIAEKNARGLRDRNSEAPDRWSKNSGRRSSFPAGTRGMAMVAVSLPPARQLPTVGAPCVSGFRAFCSPKPWGNSSKMRGFSMAEPTWG